MAQETTALCLLGALAGTAAKAAGPKREALTVYPLGRTGPGACGRMDPLGVGGDVNSPDPVREAGGFISSHDSPKGHSSAWDKTALVIVTPFHCLSSLNRPPGPLHCSLRHLCLGWKSHG